VIEMGLRVKTLGSTTLDRADLDRGSEPDNAYYIQNQPLVAGRDIDLATDPPPDLPPPDLIVEVDISHTDIDKNALYAAMGVPELWRFNGKVWRIYRLCITDSDPVYEELEQSPTFPFIVKDHLYTFLAASRSDEVAAILDLQAWAKAQRHPT
jgi:Uma2 family endonuclease